MKKPLDFKAIAARALEQIEAVCLHWLPAGKKAGPEWEIGDRHGNAGKSLKVHLTGSKAGMWSDFSTDDKGGNLVSLVAFVDGCPQLDAARKLAEFLGIATSDPETPRNTTPAPARPDPTASKAASKPAPEWRPILPVPDTASPAPSAHPKHGKPDRLYTYRGQAGELLGYVARWEANATRPKKEFGWQVFAETNGGRQEWRWQGFPVPRPLYGLETLAEHPAAAVMLCEGEKAAEACRALLPDSPAMTWPGGGKAAEKADFAPLQGRHVVLWADADEPGRQAMKTAAKLARQAGAASVRWLSLPALAKARGNAEQINDLPQGFDAADLIEEGWDAARMAVFIALPDTLLDAKTTRPPADIQDFPDTPLTTDAGRFTIAKSKLYMHKTSPAGETRRVRLSDPLQVPALARDEEGGGWAPVLEFKDRDGMKRQEIIPFRLFLGDGADGIKQLADCGLAIEPGREAIDGLKQYIASARPDKRARLVDATGWHGGAYLFPDGALGDTAETLIYRGSKRALGVFTPRGKLKDWQEQIAALAVDNPRLMFTLSTAFVGPLLKPCGGASSAFHWTGDSSLGKSGALHAADSVWGNPAGTVNSWRSTDNSLEYVAAQFNDGLLILDEIKEVDPKQAGAISYMLGNSKGKNRAHHAGGLREAITWRIAMLSSGEIGLADHLASAGQKAHAGQAVRFIELPADAGPGFYGMWNTLHHLPDGRGFTDHLKAAAAKYYGTAGRAFISSLIEHLPDVPATVQKLEKVFFDAFVPADAGGQVRRVAGAFALVAAAGELATEWRLCPWHTRDAFAAAGLMFEQWLKARPTTGNLEEATILAHVRQLMERNWQARFVDWHRVSEENADLSRMAAVHDTLGFRKRATPWNEDEPAYLFYVTRGRFTEEFCNKGGFKPRRVAAVLKAKGILKSDEDAATLKETLPNGDPRSYCIIGRKLWEGAGDA